MALTGYCEDPSSLPILVIDHTKGSRVIAFLVIID